MPFRKITCTDVMPLLSVIRPLVELGGSPWTADPGWSVMKQARKSMIWYLLLPPFAGCTCNTGT